MFKTPEFFAEIATKLESMGLSHIGNYIAGSDKFKFHVPYPEKARDTMMAFHLTSKAGVIIATLHEEIEDSKYRFYWRFEITYLFTKGHDDTFLVEETASDPYAYDPDGFESSWQEWNFPYPENWHRGFSISGGNSCTYTTENARNPNEDDPIILYTRMQERHWSTVVSDGRFPDVIPHMWAPTYCFDCEEDFNSFLTVEKLKEVAVQIKTTDFKLFRNTEYYALSDYTGDA